MNRLRELPDDGDDATPGAPGGVTSPRKVRHTFHLSADVLEEARDATDFLSGPPERMTLSRLVEDALVVALARLREVHNEGERFPPRGADLRGGRPISRGAP